MEPKLTFNKMIEITRLTTSVPMKINSSEKEIFRVIGTTDIDGKGTNHDVHDVDPFIFLDEAKINTPGTTFSPHPHSGLAAVSYIFEGEIKVWDNLNGEGTETNEAGGLYYINSGKGIVHSEVAIKPTHWVQMWLNPGIYEKPLKQAQAHLVKPDQIPVYQEEEFSARVLIGKAYGFESPVNSDWPILYMHISLKGKSKKEIELPHRGWNGYVYVVKGSGSFGQNQVEAGYQNLLEFNTSESIVLSVENQSESDLEFMLALGQPHQKAFYKLLGHGGAVVADTPENARKSMADFELDKESFGKD